MPQPVTSSMRRQPILSTWSCPQFCPYLTSLECERIWEMLQFTIIRRQAFRRGVIRLADVVLGVAGLNVSRLDSCHYAFHWQYSLVLSKLSSILVSSKHDRSSVFKVGGYSCHATVAKSICHSRFEAWFLVQIFQPLITGFIRRQIQKAIKDALITGFEYIDGSYGSSLLFVIGRRLGVLSKDGVSSSRTEVVVLEDVSLFFFF